MAADPSKRTMHDVSTPLVNEAPIPLEPVTADTFVADLDVASMAGASRLTSFLERLAASPRRRIYD